MLRGIENKYAHNRYKDIPVGNKIHRGWGVFFIHIYEGKWGATRSLQVYLLIYSRSGKFTAQECNKSTSGARAEVFKRLRSISLASPTSLLEFIRLFPNRIHQLYPKRGQEAMFRSLRARGYLPFIITYYPAISNLKNLEWAHGT